MIQPTIHKAFQGVAYQAFKPCVTGVDQGEQEVCFHLPFAFAFEDLTYLGTVSRQAWHISPHYHNHFELCYVAEGEGWFVLNGVSYPVRKGDLFLVKPWENHYGAARGDSPYCLYYLGFELSRMSKLETAFYQLSTNRVWTDQHTTARRIFNEMFTEIQMQQAHALEMIQSLLLELLVFILRLYGRNEQELEDKSTLLSPAIREVLDSLHDFERAESLLTVDALAQHVHMSRSHFVREFRRCMGIPPGEYIRAMRLEWSKRYLRESDLSISQIATYLHFASIHPFSVFFKRHTGLSPQEYRKQVLSLH